jgi:hypothetical protein
MHLMTALLPCSDTTGADGYVCGAQAHCTAGKVMTRVVPGAHCMLFPAPCQWENMLPDHQRAQRVALLGGGMVVGKPLPFLTAFVNDLDIAMQAHHPGQGLSALQRAWLAFCLTAILVTNSICWARFARASLGMYSLAA